AVTPPSLAGKPRRNAVLRRALVVVAPNPGPIERTLAHRAGRGGGIYVAIGKITLVQAPSRVAHGQKLSMRGRVPVQHDVVPTLANNAPVTHDHGAIGLVAFLHRLIAECPCPCEKTRFRSLGRLHERG